MDYIQPTLKPVYDALHPEHIAVVQLVHGELIGHGSFKIRDGSVWWCQGYSEPGSGSDLASLKTAAVRDGDDYVVNGQKIWTTNAHKADWIFTLVRTDPDSKPQRGIRYEFWSRFLHLWRL